MMPKEFSGKLAIITGAAKQNGIGFATALILAQQGADVVLHYNSNVEAAKKSVEQLQALGVKAIAVQGDAASTDFGERLVGSTLEAFPGRTIDIIVNNAAHVYGGEGINASSVEEFDMAFHVNVRGPLLLLQAAYPHLTAPGARIINVGTVLAKLGWRWASLYAASKAALNSMTAAWSEELAEKGITINVVAPGTVGTDLVPPEKHEQTQKMRSAQHIKRNGTTQEIADVIAFVASHRSSFISGQVIAVDGGV